MAEQEGQSRSVDLQRVLTKVQENPTGALLVTNAVQACVIEDQDKALEELRAELVAAGRKGDAESTPTQ